MDENSSLFKEDLNPNVALDKVNNDNDHDEKAKAFTKIVFGKVI